MRTTMAAVALCALVGSACSAPRLTPTPAGASPGATATVPGGTQAPPSGHPATVPPGSAEPTSDPTSEPTVPPGAFDPRRVALVLESVVVAGLSQPVYLTHAGDGSHLRYVVERTGTIKVLLPNGTIRSRPLLDISDRVASNGERGLYAVAFHPAFETNGRFFVHWSNARDESFIEEYILDGGGSAAPDSGRTLLQIDHPNTTDKGGWLGFGPDGYLYIGVGDGGGFPPGDPFRNGQDTSTLLGKVLRIDVDGEEPYAIPADNPFAGSTGEDRAEIWAFGLRNPWRASFDRLTGDLWIGDVGGERTEEVDVIPAGQGGLNFGWSDMEGTDCHRKRNCDPERYVAPVAQYETGARGYCAITGGYVYRGVAFPFMNGGYVYTDYCTGNIHGFDAANAMTAGSTAGRGPKIGTSGYRLASLGEDEEGELYGVDLDGGIYRLIAVELRG